jgi:hypothetical protein
LKTTGLERHGILPRREIQPVGTRVLGYYVDFVAQATSPGLVGVQLVAALNFWVVLHYLTPEEGKQSGGLVLKLSPLPEGTLVQKRQSKSPREGCARALRNHAVG